MNTAKKYAPLYDYTPGPESIPEFVRREKAERAVTAWDLLGAAIGGWILLGFFAAFVVLLDAVVNGGAR